MTVSKYQGYRVALSFSGKQRDYVQEVARHLQAKSIPLFYDGFKTSELWGRDGSEYLGEVFSELAEYVVVFISEDYMASRWPRHELRAALGRMLREEREYILPVRFDNTPVKGLPETMFYLEAKRFTPAELASKIIEKLGIPAFTGKASDVPPPRMISPTGYATFDYSNFNGRYTIGSDPSEFETKWSRSDDQSIHVYNDPPSIHGVAIDPNALAIHDVSRAETLKYTSRSQTPKVGEIVVLRNANGFYAAVQVLNIKDRTRNDERDELRFRFAIQRNGTDNFESFRNISV